MEDRSRLALGRLDLGDVVADAVEAVRPRLRPGHRLLLRRERDPVPVVGEARALAEIVTNLLDNAIQYSPAGGPIHCVVGRDRAAAVVRVIDRGIGIAEEDLPTLFTPFGRVVNDANRHVAGSGLGLHLARELALIHGGEIAVESQRGVGSAFSVVLPVLGAEPDATAGYDVTSFGLGDMVACCRAFRRIGATAAGFDQAAAAIVRHLADHLRIGPGGERTSALVRLFRVVPFAGLGAPRSEAAPRAADGRVIDPGTLCLTLVATAVDGEWDDPLRLGGDRVVPLTAGDPWPPMFARLVRDLGVEPDAAGVPAPFADMTGKTCNVFHVGEAAVGAHVPAQEEFVRPDGVRSLVGFGGVLAPADLFVVVVFSRGPIPRECAALFRAISHSATLALRPLVAGDVAAVD